MKSKNFAITLGLISVLIISMFLAGYLMGEQNAYKEVALSTRGQRQSTIGQDGQPIVVGGGCELSPTLAVSVVDEQEMGTAVTTGIKYNVNGNFLATAPSSFKAGDQVQVIVNKSSYIDTLSGVHTMTCGSNTLYINMGDYSAPTVEIKEDGDILTDSATGGAQNSTNIGLGGSETYEVCLTGNDDDTSGDLVYVIELSKAQNVSSIVLAGASEVDVPKFYEDTLSSPETVAFSIPAIKEATEKCYTLTIKAESGKKIKGAVYNTFYAAQAFVEDDGSFVASGVENDDNDVKYEATFDYDFFIVN